MVPREEEQTQELSEAPSEAPEVRAAVGSETVDLGPAGGELPDPTQQGSEPLPERVGRFVVLDKLGEGAFGVVYLAKEGNLGREVAIKFAPASCDADSLARFMAEAQITAQLDHPGVVPVYSLELGSDGTLAYAMKPIQGETLLERIQHGRAIVRDHGVGSREWRRLCNEHLERFARACEAVHFAHSRGVLHRDLKPENVMLGSHHEVYVLDWGLAKVLDREEPPAGGVDPSASPRATQGGHIKGTPLYMSPEQARGEVSELGPEADVYALGMILHELIYLTPARLGTTMVETIRAAERNALCAPPSELDTSDELRAIVAKATASDPRQRYQSADELARELRRVLRDQETLAYPDRGWRRLRRWIVRHPRLVAFLLAGGMAATAAMVSVLQLRQQEAVAEAQVEAELTQRALNDLQSLTSDRAREVAIRFLSYGRLTASLAAATTEIERDGTPGERPFPASAFELEADAPPGSVRSDHYAGRLVNPRATVGLAPPGPKGERDLALLGRLEHRLRACFASPAAPLGERAALEDAIVNHLTPLEWAYVALDRSGALVLFPASSGDWGASYDPRQRPWYREAVQVYRRSGRSLNWSNPYLDIFGQGVVITCTQVVQGEEGEVLGVAALDISVGELSASLLRFPELAGFRRAALLDPRGRVLLTSGGGKPVSPPPPYRHAEAAAAVRAGRSGLFSGRDAVVAWSVLPQLGWAVVVEAERAALLNSFR